MSDQLRTSIQRFILPAIFGGLLSGLTTYQATQNWSAAIVTGLITLATPLASAAGWGVYDGDRAKKGDVHGADVRLAAVEAVE